MNENQSIPPEIASLKKLAVGPINTKTIESLRQVVSAARKLVLKLDPKSADTLSDLEFSRALTEQRLSGIEEGCELLTKNGGNEAVSVIRFCLEDAVEQLEFMLLDSTVNSEPNRQKKQQCLEKLAELSACKYWEEPLKSGALREFVRWVQAVPELRSDLSREIISVLVEKRGEADEEIAKELGLGYFSKDLVGRLNYKKNAVALTPFLKKLQEISAEPRERQPAKTFQPSLPGLSA